MGQATLTLVVFDPTDDPTSWSVFYLSENVRETLLVRLFIFGELANIFERMHPEDDQATDFSVRTWKIHYPANVRISPLHLERRTALRDGVATNPGRKTD